MVVVAMIHWCCCVHAGYRDQVQKWPENPLHVIIKWLQGLRATSASSSAPSSQEQQQQEQEDGDGQSSVVGLAESSSSKKKKKKKKNKGASLVVADFGCGDAVLAQSLASKGGGFTVHSFDLVAKNDLVTACDMAKVFPAIAMLLLFC